MNSFPKKTSWQQWSRLALRHRGVRDRITPQRVQKCCHSAKTSWNQFSPSDPPRLEKSCRRGWRQIIIRSSSDDRVTHHAGLPSFLPPPPGGVRRRRNTRSNRRTSDAINSLVSLKKDFFSLSLSEEWVPGRASSRGRKRAVRRWRWEEHGAQTPPALTICLRPNVCCKKLPLASRDEDQDSHTRQHTYERENKKADEDEDDPPQRCSRCSFGWLFFLSVLVQNSLLGTQSAVSFSGWVRWGGSPVSEGTSAKELRSAQLRSAELRGRVQTLEKSGLVWAVVTSVTSREKIQRSENEKKTYSKTCKRQ